MKGQRHTLLALGAAVLLVVGVAAQAPVTPRPATAKPNDEVAKAPTRLVAPFRGEAEIYYTKPATKQVGTMVVSTMRIMNPEKAPIAGLRIDEFWYDKDGQPVTGSKTFRHPKPLQPGEVVDVKLESPRHPAMSRNSFKFEHANGKVKPVAKPKL